MKTKLTAQPWIITLATIALLALSTTQGYAAYEDSLQAYWEMDGTTTQLTSMPTGYSSSTQGVNNWYYYRSNVGTNTYTQLTAASGQWTANGQPAGPGNEYFGMQSRWCHPGSTTYGDAVRAWKSTVTGTLYLNSTLFDTQPEAGDGVVCIIKKNATQLSSTSCSNGFTAKNVFVKTDVAANDMIYFRVNQGANNQSDGTDYTINISQVNPGSAIDSKGSNTGTLNNGVTYAPTGKFGNAVSFNGTNTYIAIPDNNNLDVGTSDFSAGFWFNSTSADSNERGGIDKRDANNAQAVGYDLYYVSGSINAFICDGTANRISIAGPNTGTWNDGNWHYAVLTADRNGYATVYIDGIAGTTVSIGSQQGTLANSLDLTIGRHTSSYYYDGLIDDTAIWARALDMNEIAAIYSLGTVGLNLDAFENMIYGIKTTYTSTLGYTNAQIDELLDFYVAQKNNPTGATLTMGNLVWQYVSGTVPGEETKSTGEVWMSGSTYYIKLGSDLKGDPLGDSVPEPATVVGVLGVIIVIGFRRIRRK